MTPAVRARRRRTRNGIGSGVVYPTCAVGKQREWQSTLPTWKHPRPTSRPPARSRIAATDPGRRCSSRRPAGRRAIRRRDQPGSSRSRLPRRHPQRLRDPARADDRRRLPADAGHPQDRRRRRLGRARQPRHRPRAHRHHGRSLLGRLDPRGGARDPGPRRHPARRLSRLEALAARRVHAVRDLRRVRHLPGHEPRRPPRPPRREAAREPSGRRQLPVGAHGSLGRPARWPADRARLEDPEPRRPDRPLVARRRDSGVRRLVAHAARHASHHRCRGRRAHGHRRSLHHDLRGPGRGRRSSTARRRRSIHHIETTEGKA